MDEQKLLWTAGLPVVEPDSGSCRVLLILLKMVLFVAVAPNRLTEAPDLCDSTGCDSPVTGASSRGGCGLHCGCPFPTCMAAASDRAAAGTGSPLVQPALIPSLSPSVLSHVE